MPKIAVIHMGFAAAPEEIKETPEERRVRVEADFAQIPPNFQVEIAFVLII